MAKPKQDTLVKVSPSGAVTVWTNDPKSATFEIADIEGVSFVVGGRKNPISVYLDQRYDINEVAKEIEQLLSSEVPEAFLE